MRGVCNAIPGQQLVCKPIQGPGDHSEQCASPCRACWGLLTGVSSLGSQAHCMGSHTPHWGHHALVWACTPLARVMRPLYGRTYPLPCSRALVWHCTPLTDICMGSYTPIFTLYGLAHPSLPLVWARPHLPSPCISGNSMRL